MKKKAKEHLFVNLALCIVTGVLALTGCMNDHVTGTPEWNVSATGTANLVVKLGKVGTLAKRSAIEMEKLVIQISVKETDSIVVADTSDLSGHDKITISKTYTELTAPEDFQLSVKSIDKNGEIIHQGTTDCSTIPGDTVDVSINLDARYSMLRVRFNDLPDSVNKVELGVAGFDTLDSAFTAGSRHEIVLEYDYLETNAEGINYDISLRAGGCFYGNDTVLYAADTTIFTRSGVDTSYKIMLKWIGPDIPHGAAAITVTVGIVGTTRINAEFTTTKVNGLIAHGNFAVTTDAYYYTADWDSIVSSLSGNLYKVADWTDLKSFHEGGGDLVELMDAFGFEYPGLLSNAFVKYNGGQFYTSTRAYFISRHDHNCPSDYLVHDEIDNNLISLGSYEATQIILMVKR